MKHYLRFILVLLLSTVWCVGGYSQETKTYNYKFKSGDFSTSKYSATLGGVNWTLTVNSWSGLEGYGFDNNNITARGFKIGSNNTNYPEDATLSTDGINGTITSIVVNTSGNSKTTAKLDVTVGDKAFGVQKKLTATATDFIFEGSATGKIELKYTNSNKPIYIKSITVTYKEAPSKALTSLAISGTPTKTKYNDGEEFDPTGLVVTGTYDDNSTATITDGITWERTPATLAVGTTSCSVTATVNGVTSPAYEVTGLTVVKLISLSIDPATSTVVKAPVTITLTATEGAAVYYTTNGDEPTTSSTKYNAPFEVTKSGTTVKAIAVAEGAEDVKAEATYTIKPDQPVFSEESKTFKDAFDVTLSLPESADATSEIHYAIGATATAESPVYSGPVNISAENDGGNVILHAVVVDQYGNVGKEKYCTYTKSTAIVFDFTADPNVWGITPEANNLKTGKNVIAGKELEVDGVVMTATNGSNYCTCIYRSTSSVNLRVYTGGSITFTAPEGYNLSNITFDFDNKGTFSTDVKTWKTPKWTGNAHTVKFTCTNSIQVNTATIKLVVATPVTPEVTSGTLEFKAVADGIYYATFSSSKNVVFPKTNVDVYSYNVSNGKGTQNKLTEYYYEVTDATAGEEGYIDGYYVPANTGVLILSLNTTTPYYFPKEAQTITLPANQLKPAPVGGGKFTAEPGYKYYKLAYDNYTAQTGLGFYWGAENAGAFKVKAGTAYLAVPTSEANNAKGFAFDGETTGIENVNVAANQNKTIYNLNGQRVSNMSQAGLYIVNGKKVVIRK